MTPTEIRQIIQAYVDFVEKPTKPILDNLLINIDSLLYAYHQAKYDYDDNDYADAPDKDFDGVYKMVCDNFPDYGYYNIPEDIIENVGDSKCMVGDVTDDISDIYSDMKEVLWHWENTSKDNALWYFASDVSSHWRDHARWLQYYFNSLKYV